MIGSLFDVQIESSLQRLEALMEEPAEGLPQRQKQLLATALTELAVTLQQLQVAGEELQATNDELAAAQQALEWERRRSQELFEFAPDAYLVTDTAGAILEANRAAAALLNCPHNDLRGKPLSLFVALEDRQKFRNSLNPPPPNAETRLGALHLQPAGGELFAVPKTQQFSLAPMRDAAGTLTGWRWLLQDAAPLSQCRKRNRRGRPPVPAPPCLPPASILSQLSDAVVATDREGRIIYWNQAAERLYSMKSEEVLGRPAEEACQVRWSNPCDESAAREALNSTGSWRGELAHLNGSAEQISVEVSASLLKDETGAAAGLVSAIRDISDRRRAQLTKDEFIATVSHELRTPLTSIHGSLGLLTGGLLTAQPEKAQRMLEIAATNTERLVRLINDLLDLERMTSGQVALKKQACNAADLMVQASDLMRDMAEKAGITLSAEPVLGHPQGVFLEADPDRILQTLTNLLSNAIKFSPPQTTVWLTGEVLSCADAINCVSPPLAETGFIRSEISSRDAGVSRLTELRTGRLLLIAVKDHGRGIPPEKLETVFERFQQVDAADSRQKGGTGLGLAISRTIVEQHGGRIWAESAPGEGSTFFLTLPLPGSSDNFCSEPNKTDG
ncbi:MAG: cell wall metabolism sensor histidine kinase WalK [Oscillatoria princeps RMCB-10]|jgi:PAS domain S-box-containing protein|nr:cell wall metabolism sensor histidine kinase WalK [Oscillatoria princeps RMCB-10]